MICCGGLFVFVFLCGWGCDVVGGCFDCGGVEE